MDNPPSFPATDVVYGQPLIRNIVLTSIEAVIFAIY